MITRNMMRRIGQHIFPGRTQLSNIMKQLVREVTPDKSVGDPPRHAKPIITEPRPHRNEAYYRDKLAKQLHGDIEIPTPNGRIDIVTFDSIIEVKQVKRWKDALGQIKAYGRFYPTHQKRIHLFGDRSRVNVAMVEKTCRENAVVVTWEEDVLE